QRRLGDALADDAICRGRPHRRPRRRLAARPAVPWQAAVRPAAPDRAAQTADADADRGEARAADAAAAAAGHGAVGAAWAEGRSAADPGVWRAGLALDPQPQLRRLRPQRR